MRNLKTSVGHIRRLFVAMVLCLLGVLSVSANAAAPITGGWKNAYGQTGGDPEALAIAACGTKYGGTGHTVRLDASTATTRDYACRVAAGGGTTIGSTSVSASSYCQYGSTAPNTSLPLAQQCPDPPNNCPTAGTSAGITNVTTAWANGPDITSKIQTKVVPDGAIGTVGAVNYCVSSCGITNSGAAPTDCWQSSIASSTGLYRLSCDVPMQSTGQPCTVGTGGSSLPDPTVPPPAPACAGSSGTVNGKTVCLDAPTSTPNATVPYPKPGNPAPGTTGGGDKSSSVDVGTGAGVGTNGTGTGGAGGSSGGGGSVTVNVPETATCGLPGKPKCQMDETGTPTNGDSTFATAKEALDAAVTAHTNAMTQVTSDDNKDTSWGWFPTLPQGECTPLQMGNLPPINWCSIVPNLKEIVAWCWGLISLFLILGMTQKAIRGN